MTKKVKKSPKKKKLTSKKNKTKTMKKKHIKKPSGSKIKDYSHTIVDPAHAKDPSKMKLKQKKFPEKKKTTKKNNKTTKDFDKEALVEEVSQEINQEKRGADKQQENDDEDNFEEIDFPDKDRITKKKSKKKKSKSSSLDKRQHIRTGIKGFDELFEKGIPQGSAVLVAGGAGSGKTIFCLQTLLNHAKNGKKCFYMSFEESENRLTQHMEQFGWNPKKYIKSGKLRLKRYSPFEISRQVEAMLEREKGELLIDLDPVILPKGFKPDFIVLDSLTAVASAFTGKEDSYRIYIEQLFRFLENMGTTSFLITETQQVPKIYSTTGVEEFLADGVIVFYNLKRGDIKENAIEVLKMRGENHRKKIVAMQINDKGIVVYPDQEVFTGLN